MSSTVASTDFTKAEVKVEVHFVEIRVAHRGGLPPWAPRKGSTVPAHATLTTRSTKGYSCLGSVVVVAASMVAGRTERALFTAPSQTQGLQTMESGGSVV